MAIGLPELIIVVIILLLLIGGRKLPELGRGAGEALSELKKAVKREKRRKKKNTDDSEIPAPQKKSSEKPQG